MANEPRSRDKITTPLVKTSVIATIRRAIQAAILMRDQSHGTYRWKARIVLLKSEFWKEVPS
jgi:hypothetical protein